MTCNFFCNWIRLMSDTGIVYELVPVETYFYQAVENADESDNVDDH